MMDIPPFQLLINQIDELIFAETGENLDDLQYNILEGALKQLKYKEIAKKNRRSEKYVQDVAGKLWQNLSEVLGKKVGKSNIKSTLQRYYYSNFSNVVKGENNLQVNKSNICTNPPEENESQDKQVYSAPHLKVVPELIREGLTVEQIARVFQLPLDIVQQQVDRV